MNPCSCLRVIVMVDTSESKSKYTWKIYKKIKKKTMAKIQYIKKIIVKKCDYSGKVFLLDILKDTLGLQMKYILLSTNEYNTFEITKIGKNLQKSKRFSRVGF